MISIFYNTTGNLVGATLNWTILFPSLENIYKVIDPLEIKGVRDYTLWNDLLNYSPRSQNDDPYEFELYDKLT